MKSRWAAWYEATVFRYPSAVIIFLLLLMAGSSWYALQLRMDASADSLVLENDDDLRYFREVAERYGEGDFLVIAYRPENDLFAPETLERIDTLREELLAAVPQLDSVFTLLDAPLIDSPPVGLSDLGDGLPTLRDERADREMARRELRYGPAYGNNLVSEDGDVTAMLLSFKRDQRYFELLEKRNELRRKARNGQLEDSGREQLGKVERTFTEYKTAYNDQRSEDIETIRNLMVPHREHGKLFLGGASMIATDTLQFIRDDLKIFGLGIFVLLVLTMAVIFRKPRWVALPLFSCAMTALVTTGLLGLLDWPISVISSNYISLLLIITLSMNIHLVVRYRLLHAEEPEQPHRDRVLETMRQMARPCFFMTITTMVAFASLVVSGIRPVIDFGYMMVCGVAIGFVISFLVFPLILSMLKPGEPTSPHDHTEAFTLAVARTTLRYDRWVMVLFVAAVAITAVGITRLEVENRFIDYFKDDTEIHQGMLVIDQKLGGTTPLDVVIQAPDSFYQKPEEEALSGEEAIFGDEAVAEDDEDAWLADAYADEEESELPESYWFTPRGFEELERVHDYLDSVPEIGKVMSLATAVKMVRSVNGGDPLGPFETSILRKNMPEAMSSNLVEPYWSIEGHEVRLTTRVRDSNPSLRRNELIERVREHLTGEIGYPEERVRLSGMLVLYNNMLQSLFDSQIQTLGAVLLAIFLMFLVLFRSVAVSLVTIVPNALAAVSILGLIGWLGIPLDFMTITIAAITIGIAVDDAIHYIHNVREALAENGMRYREAIPRAHGSVGKAMFYTTLTIIMGFSILVLSNFVPSVYFGVLAGIAMFVALVCNLVLLPSLVVWLKPMGPEGAGEEAESAA